MASDNKVNARIEEAQRVIETAATGGFFDRFSTEANVRATHLDLRQSVIDLLSDEFSDLDVIIYTYPNSEYVDVRLVPKDDPAEIPAP